MAKYQVLNGYINDNVIGRSDQKPLNCQMNKLMVTLIESTLNYKPCFDLQKVTAKQISMSKYAKSTST